jgi:hypothetical protein
MAVRPHVWSGVCSSERVLFGSAHRHAHHPRLGLPAWHVAAGCCTAVQDLQHRVRDFSKYLDERSCTCLWQYQWWESVLFLRDCTKLYCHDSPWMASAQFCAGAPIPCHCPRVNSARLRHYLLSVPWIRYHSGHCDLRGYRPECDQCANLHRSVGQALELSLCSPLHILRHLHRYDFLSSTPPPPNHLQNVSDIFKYKPNTSKCPP